MNEIFQLVNILNNTRKNSWFHQTQFTLAPDQQSVAGTNPGIAATFEFKLSSSNTLLVITGTNDHGTKVTIYTKTDHLGTTLIAPDIILALSVLHNFDFRSDAEFVVQNNKLRKIYRSGASDATTLAKSIPGGASDDTNLHKQTTVSFSKECSQTSLRSTRSDRSRFVSFVLRCLFGKHSSI